MSDAERSKALWTAAVKYRHQTAPPDEHLSADWEAHEAEESKYRDAERLRLLYVAGTRAKELLVVCRSGDASKNRAWDVFEGFVAGVPEVEVPAPKAVAKYVAVKGSICIDGVSLTVNRVRAAEFDVNLIPHTLKVTTLSRLKVGSEVNLEADLIARYVEGIASRR